ncbi:hypothetical protein YC2023_087671 [Brassica napus]
MLVVVTYSGMHLMISHGFPVVEQVSLVISCYVVLLYDVHQTVKDPSGYYLIIVELSSGYDGSLSVNLGMFGQGSMGRIWARSIMDRIGIHGSGSDTMLS